MGSARSYSSYSLNFCVMRVRSLQKNSLNRSITKVKDSLDVDKNYDVRRRMIKVAWTL